MVADNVYISVGCHLSTSSYYRPYKYGNAWKVSVVCVVVACVRSCSIFVFLQSLFSKVREELVSLYYVTFLVLRCFAVIWFYFLVHGSVSFRRWEPWVSPPP